jgi:hypothetical protein
MGVWARVRAALIGLFIVVSLIDGFPFPRGGARERLPGSLQAAVIHGEALQQVLLSPFAWFKRLFRLGQRWALFSSAKQQRHWLSIEARTAGSRRFHVIYRPLDPEHQELASMIEYRRVRAAWNAGRKDAVPSYRAFATWIARREFSEHGDVTAVRVRFELVDVLPRGAGFRPSGKYVQALVEKRPTRASEAP